MNVPARQSICIPVHPRIRVMSEPVSIWEGYLRADGRKGVRNLVLIIYTVECAQFVAHAIAQGEPDTHVIGFSGCYDNNYAIRLMLALARHPNVGAVLSVGLGCEYTQPQKIAEVVRASARPAEWFFIQEAGGTSKSIAQGKNLLAGLREKIATVKRVPMTLADLTVGCECGGSDGTSGLAWAIPWWAHFLTGWWIRWRPRPSLKRLSR